MLISVTGVQGHEIVRTYTGNRKMPAGKKFFFTDSLQQNYFLIVKLYITYRIVINQPIVGLILGSTVTLVMLTTNHAVA